MTSLINRLWLGILIYSVYSVYDSYATKEERKNEIKQEISQLSSKIQKQRRQIKLIQEYQKDIEAKKNEIEEVAIQIENLQKRFPREVSDPENIKIIKELSDALKIRDLNITPEQDIVNGFYIVKRYKIVAEATYLQFLLLLERIAENERILNVNGIHLKRMETKRKQRYQPLEVEAVVETYKYNPGHKENRGITEIEARLRNEAKNKGAASKKKRNNRKKKGKK